MKSSEHSVRGPCVNDLARPGKAAPAVRPGLLGLVTVHELEALRLALGRGELPPDLEAKLTRLTEGDLTHRFVARNCRLFVELLLAVQAGSFRDASQPESERLLRVLAYVRKDDDGIPDYKPGGFLDDQAEVRAALLEFQDRLKSFKAWRLRQQVPGLWLANQARPVSVIN
jgi:hypothetical protein